MDEESKVIVGNEDEVKVKKKTFWHKVKQAILPEGETSFKNFFVNAILLPWIRDGFWYGMDRIRYRDASAPPIVHTNGQNGNYVPYSKRSSSVQQTPRPSNEKYLWDYDDLAFNNPGFAARVLEDMRDQLAKYGAVSVADMYDFAGQQSQSSWAYRNYGWTDLSTARVFKFGVDYYIDLPKARPLDNPVK